MGGNTGIFDCIELAEVIVRDKEPLSYPWKTLFEQNHYSTFLNNITPFFIEINGNQVPNPDAYNCHFYSFGSVHPNDPGYDPQWPKWATIPNNIGYTEVPSNLPLQAGDRIIYFDVVNGLYGVTHSGIVIEIDNDGNATKISSKMGEYEIIEHHPRDIPEEHGSTEPSIYHDGEIKPTRRYFRN